ncbi:MAG: diguanylate cyclase [Myxococcales bacterium]|nr:diguanylate cyclase [Myxococcales bacterium]
MPQLSSTSRRRHSSLVSALVRARRGQNTVAAFLEALPDQAAVLDADGVIVHANQPWRDSARDNGGDMERVDRGATYLSACEPTEHTPELAELRDMLQAVLTGQRARFSYEYPCHSPTERRWFLMRAGHLTPGGALVTHTNITARKLAELHADELANHDPLTGTLNRRGFSRRLHLELARRRRQGGALCAVLLDCDDFKDVNSRFGHAVGDVILVELARRFCDVLRPDDAVARIGGDEMVVLLPDTNSAEARRVGERLRLAVATSPFATKHGVHLQVTCSAAVVSLGQDAAGAVTISCMPVATDSATARAPARTGSPARSPPAPSPRCPVSCACSPGWCGSHRGAALRGAGGLRAADPRRPRAGAPGRPVPHGHRAGRAAADRSVVPARQRAAAGGPAR